MTLVDLCINKIIILLQRNYWPVGRREFQSCNPFAALASELNEKLIATVIKSTSWKKLKVDNLYPMLVSGGVRKFEIKGVKINYEEFIRILTTLSIHGDCLRKLILENIQLVPSQASKRFARFISAAIENLLVLSPNLNVIRVGVPFDLTFIQGINALQELELSFSPKNRLSDIIPKFNGDWFVNNSLTHLSVVSPLYSVPAEEIALLLEYCTELVHLGHDISEGIELLHESEFSSGTLSKEYKLEKVVLGRLLSYYVDSSLIVDIISLTCTNLKDLEIFVNDHSAVLALRQCKNLEALSVQWKFCFMESAPGNFISSILEILKEIGPRLKKLGITNFYNVNFDEIENTCPELKSLTVDYVGLYTSSDKPSFKHLEYLHLSSFNEEGISPEVLMQCLSSCKDVTYLYLENAFSLDDELMEQILTVNSLSKLNEVYLIDCFLSEDCLRQFVLKRKNTLKAMYVTSEEIDYDTVIDIIRLVDPKFRCK